MAFAALADTRIPAFAGQARYTSDSNTFHAHEQTFCDALALSSSAFFSTCHESFLSELSTLSSDDLKQVDIDLSDFSKSSNLLTPSNTHCRRGPVVSGPTISPLQTLRYRAVVDQLAGSSSYILKHNARPGAGVLYSYLGIFSAFVPGTSVNTLTLLSRTVGVYRLAVRIGVRTRLYSRKALSAASQDHDTSLPWSVIFIGLMEDDVGDAIRTLNQRIGVLILSVSAIIDANFIAVSRRRRNYLVIFFASLPAKAAIRLGTFPHGSAVSNLVCDCILPGITMRSIAFPAFPEVPCREVYSSDAITRDVTNYETLVELILEMIINQPIKWTAAIQRSIATVHVDIPVRPLDCVSGPSLTEVIDCGPSRGYVPTFTLSETGFNNHVKVFTQRQTSVPFVGIALNVKIHSTSEKVVETGISAITEVSERRSNHDSEKDPKRSVKDHVGGFIGNVDLFNNESFKISHCKAHSTVDHYKGAATHAYSQNMRNEMDAYCNMGAEQLGGPPATIDTVPFSSTTFHQSARALVNEARDAVPSLYVLGRDQTLDPTRESKAFDVSADNYSGSEAVGLFESKRSLAAVVENDNTLNVISAIQVNQSGHPHFITPPYAHTQANFSRHVLDNMGIDIHRVDVGGFRGTGAQTGDPHGLENIKCVPSRPLEKSLHIAFAHSYIRYQESVFGSAALAEHLLMLRHKTFPRGISAEKINPQVIDLLPDNAIIDGVQIRLVLTEEGKYRLVLLNDNFDATGSKAALDFEIYLSPTTGNVASSLSLVSNILEKDSNALEVLRRRIIDRVREPVYAAKSLLDMEDASIARRHHPAVDVNTKQKLAENSEKRSSIQVDEFPHVRSRVGAVAYPITTMKSEVLLEEDVSLDRATGTVTPSPPQSTDYKMMNTWSQHSTKENGNVAVFETPICELESSIRGHYVAGIPLCPASAYFELVLAGLKLVLARLSTTSPETHVILRSIEFAKPLLYEMRVSRTVITNIRVGADGRGTFFVASRVEGSKDEVIHVRGEYKSESISKSLVKFHRILPVINRRIAAALKAKNSEEPQHFSTRTVYEIISPRAVDYAKEYHTIQSITVDSTGTEGYAVVKLPASYDSRKFVAHPVFTETLLHVAGFIANMHGGINDAFICSGVGSVKILAGYIDSEASYGVYCSIAWLPDQGIMLAEAHAVKLAHPHILVAHLKGMHFRRVRLNGLKKSLVHDARTLSSKSCPASSLPKPALITSAPAPIVRTTLPSSPRVVTVARSEVPSPRKLAASGSLPAPTPLNVVSDSSSRAPSLESQSSGLSKPVVGKPTTPEVVPTKAIMEETSEFSITISPMSASRLTRALKLDTVPLSLQKSASHSLPLFLIHDGSGLINYYNGITSLERPVWGFNNPHFVSSKPWSGGVPAMAAAYANHISKITTGPVILGGWSFGGVAAYETSLQLAKMGIKTQGILLIDSPSPINHVPLSDALIDSVINLDARSANSDLGRLVKAQFAMNARMLGKYDPRATGGACPPLVLLRSSEGFCPLGVSDVPIWLADRSDPAIATAGWESLASEPLTVLDIPGHHFTPFYPANIKSVADRMRQGCELLEGL